MSDTLTFTDFAIALLDDVLKSRGVEIPKPENAGGIETTGCPKCGGTMYRTYETDDKGNRTGQSQFICQGCGHMM
jgi:transposase-like protein